MQQSITQFDDEDYYKHGVIKPPSDFFGDNQRITRIVVDSRVRDVSLFPNQCDYDVYFEDDINDIVSAQLVYVDVPFSNYLINTYFNRFIISYGGTDYTIILDKGDYTKDTIVTEINYKLDAALGSGVVVISYIEKTDNYKFTCTTGPFTLKFSDQTNTLAMLLGFNRTKNYTSSGTGPYTVFSEYKRNFNYNNYIIMDIDQFDLLKSIDKDLNKSFAMIPLNYDTLNLADNPQYIKRFSPAISKLTKLHVRFYDRFGNPYDFQNMDHRFEIELTSFKQRRKYGNIFAH